MRQDVQRLAQDYLPPVRLASPAGAGQQRIVHTLPMPDHPPDVLQNPASPADPWPT